MNLKKKANLKFYDQSKKLLSLINSFTHGVRAYDENLDIVQTSINLATLRMQDNQIKFALFARSNILDGLKQVEFETLEFFQGF